MYISTHIHCTYVRTYVLYEFIFCVYTVHTYVHAGMCVYRHVTYMYVCGAFVVCTLTYIQYKCQCLMCSVLLCVVSKTR